MELDRSLWGGLSEQLQAVSKRFNEDRVFRGLACAALGLWSMGVTSAGIKSLEDAETVRLPEYEGITYTEEEVQGYADAINKRTAEYAEAEAAMAIQSPEQTSAVPPETVTTQPTTTRPPTLAEQIIGVELDPRVETAISSMELTVDGYNQFLQSIDTSHVSWSQQFREFNPGLLSDIIIQGPSEMFIAHFTTVYANDQPGFGSVMVGNFNVSNFIQSIAGRYGLNSQCCGVNWAIDRHGNTYQLAPLDAKLNHNPPYDPISTSVEIESLNQASITTDQYESLAYLSLAVLDTQGRLGNFVLQDIFKGHGEMRDEWNHNHPGNKLNHRDDFDAPPMQFFRHYVQQFLDQNPQIVGLQPLQNFPK